MTLHALLTLLETAASGHNWLMTAPVPTKTIDEKYQVLKTLGAGGFGVVYLTRDLALGRTVAVKVLELVNSWDAARFEREAKALSRLGHENIVDVFAYGRDDTGKPYIVMQYLDGETLGKLLLKECRIGWERAVKIGVQICDGVHFAHQQGIVHRDLKPDNIMLIGPPQHTQDFVKVLDFGLSSFQFESPEAIQKLTQTGNVVGTAQYISPEAAVGRATDARSDVYSLGCVLYQAMTGRPPFEAQDVLNVLYDHVNRLPPRFDEALGVPENIELAIFKAVQKKPEDRYQSMQEFSTALNAVLADPATAGVNFKSVKLPGNRSTKRRAPLANKGLAKVFAMCTIMVAVIIAGAVTLHPVPAPGPNNSPQRGADVWQHEQDLARIEFERLRPDSAVQHYLNAIAAAPSENEKLSTEILLGEMVLDNISPESRAKIRPLLEHAYAHASNPKERARAQTFLGHATMEAGDHGRAIALLKDEPWLVYADMIGSNWYQRYSELARASSLRLAQQYALKSDREKAIHWYEKYYTFDKNSDETPASAQNKVEFAKLLLQSDTSKRKERALQLLHEALPYTVAGSDERKYAETMLGSIAQPAYSAVSAEVLKSAPELGTGHQTLIEPADASLDNVYLANQHWLLPDLNAALTRRYYLGLAADAPSLRKRIAECDELLRKCEPKSQAADLLRTCEGIGYGDLEQYDKAQEFLKDHPWNNVEARIFDSAVREAAADALASVYMRGPHPEPQKALDELAPFPDGVVTASQTIMLRGCALLMLSDTKPQFRNEAREHLKYLLVARYRELSKKEWSFYKAVLKRYNLLDLWGPGSD